MHWSVPQTSPFDVFLEAVLSIGIGLFIHSELMLVNLVETVYYIVIFEYLFPVLTDGKIDMQALDTNHIRICLYSFIRILSQ